MAWGRLLLTTAITNDQFEYVFDYRFPRLLEREPVVCIITASMPVNRQEHGGSSLLPEAMKNID